MFHIHRKALGTGLATAVTLATTAAPGALAQPINPQQPRRSPRRGVDAARERSAQPGRPGRRRRPPDRRDQPADVAREPAADHQAARGRERAVLGP
jgi:hypothetical protein